MRSLALMIVPGLLLGIRHAADPDHVAAVVTIVSRQASFWRAVGVGMLWGLGHTATVALAAGLILALELTVPPRLGLALEFVVALMLVALGVRALLDRTPQGTPSPMRPVLVGMVHGLAGSAAVALLVLAMIDGPARSAIYVLVFSLGTVVGMVLVTALVALPSLYAATRVPALVRHFRVLAGAVSLIFGLFLAHQIGVQDRLFGTDPTWSPQ